MHTILIFMFYVTYIHVARWLLPHDYLALFCVSVLWIYVTVTPNAMISRHEQLYFCSTFISGWQQSKFYITHPVWADCTADQRVSSSDGHWCENRFHVMMSPWNVNYQPYVYNISGRFEVLPPRWALSYRGGQQQNRYFTLFNINRQFCYVNTIYVYFVHSGCRKALRSYF